LIGLYPFVYFFIERTFGLLQWKTESLLSNTIWNIAFYAHIIPGGIALMIGWSQFIKKWRVEKMHLHRRIGKAYMLLVLISGFSGLYIAFHATGGTSSIIGFASLAVIWLASTYTAYRSVLDGNIKRHQKMMVYSYAACCSAVTLRIWLPILSIGFGEFYAAYKIVAWLAWVPNLIVAWYINRK